MASTTADDDVDGSSTGRGIRPELYAGTRIRAAAAQEPSEDCLYLNVWRPADPGARNLTVMVWIYGGGFVAVRVPHPLRPGVQFAKQGVVLVAMNYRVGRFGFFAFPALSSERVVCCVFVSMQFSPGMSQFDNAAAPVMAATGKGHDVSLQAKGKLVL